MKVFMLGPLAVHVGDDVRGPSDFGGLKPKQVLEILLLAGGHPVSKDALVEALWPERPPRHVIGTLESYVSVLRRQLADTRKGSRRFIGTAPGAYRIVRDHVWVDAWEFESLLDQATDTTGGERLRLLRRAVKLVGGDLLEDAPYAEWAQRERGRYRDLRFRANLQIADELLRRGDASVSLHHAELALRIDSLAEEAWQAVMRAHHAMGHRDAAARALQRCRQVLGAELGVAPARETEILGEHGLHGFPPSPAVHSRTSSPRLDAAGDGAVSDRRGRAGRLPFLGRSRELAALRTAVESATAGGCAVVLVEARAGMGRSALLDRFASEVSVAMGRFSYSRFDQRFPAAPLAGALGDAIARAGVDARDAVDRWAEDGTHLPAPERLDRLTELLRLVGPAVLLLDDLHFADDQTLDLIDELGRRGEHRLAIVGSVRRDDVRFGEVSRRLASASPIVLGPLEEDDLVGLGANDRQLLRFVGGHPGLMADHWRWIAGGHSGYSPTLAAAVKRQVASLGRPLSDVLQAAATLEEPVESFDLVEALDRSILDLTSQLRIGLDLGLLELADGGYRFREPVVREILRATVPAPRRRLIARSRHQFAPRLTRADAALISQRRASPRSPLLVELTARFSTA